MVHGKALHLMQHHRVMLVILDAPVGVKLVAILDVDLDALADGFPSTTYVNFNS